MELSFSSEKAEYDDDPTAGRESAAAAAAVASRPQPSLAPLPLPLLQRKPSPSLRSVAPLPVQRPLQVQGGWGASSMAAPAPLPVPVAAAAASSSSSHGNGAGSGGGGFFASLSRPKVGGGPSAKVAAQSSETEQIQAFDPTDMETSTSRRSAPATPSSVRRREKAARAAVVEARRRARENAAPGAIDDDVIGGGSSARKPARPSEPGVLSVDFGPVASAAAPKPGGGAGGAQSMIADLGRRGGKGAFALSGDLNFSSDEEEEGAPPGAAKAKKKKKEEKKSSGESSGSSDKQRQPDQSDVAPLINDVALDFVLRRWASTLLGGVAPCWSARPSDERQPALPMWIVAVQLLWLLYPVLIGLVCDALYFKGVIAQQGIMALIAGVVGAACHLALHLTHRAVVRRPNAAAAATRGGGSTRVADVSSVAAGGASSSNQPNAAGSNLDNYESLLQAQVKAAAIRAGTLPKKAAVAKSKRKDEEEEDDASRPPGVAPKRAAAAADDSDDEDASDTAKDAPPLGMLSPALWCFLISPAPRPLHRTVAHALLAGIMLAGATYFLEWGFISAQWGGSLSVSAGAGVYLAAAWLAFALCFYSLNVRPPVELCQWGPGGSWVETELNAPLLRCTYAAGIILYSGCARILATEEPASLSRSATDLHPVLLVFFPVLPVLFCTGCMPPLDAVASWGTEQVNVVLFGGSAAASERRAAAYLAAHTLAAAVVFLVWLHGSHSAAMLFAAGLAFILSWSGIPLRWGTAASASSASAPGSDAAGGEAVEDPDSPFFSFNSRALWPLRLSTLFKLILGLGACAAGLVLSQGLSSSTDGDFIDALGALTPGDAAFDAVALALLLFFLAHASAHRPYLWGGLLRNPLYSWLVLSAPGPSVLRQARPVCHVQGRGAEVAAWVCRAFLVVYVAFHQDAGLFLRDSSAGSAAAGRIHLSDASHAGKLSLFAYSALLFRSFRVVFMQTPSQSLSQLLLVVAVNLATGGAEAEGSGSLGYWHDLDWTVRFLIAGFVLRRCGEELLPKLWFMTSFTVAVFTEPKQRVRKAGLMRGLCALLLPYHLGLALVSAFLAAPVLPLLGSPVFLLGFPRPQRLWPRVGGRYGMNESAAESAVNGGQDTFFYQQMFPSIYGALDESLRAGQLAWGDLVPGQFFLLRLEPYLVWGMVLERGLGYVVLQLKGLELASTSCHTAEALRLDEVLEATLDAGDASAFSAQPLLARDLSPFWRAYTPRMLLRRVRSFSITKNVLTGIIDDRENLATLSNTFLRCVAREIWGHICEQGRHAQGSGSGPGAAAGVAALPEHWRKAAVSNYDLQQLEERYPWPKEYIAFLLSAAVTRGSASGSAAAASSAPPPFLSDADRAVFKRVVQSSFAVVELLASEVVSSPGGRPTPAHALSVFEGKIGTSLQSDYLLAQGSPDAAALKALVVRAYRAALKALYDCAALGSLETLTDGSSPEQFAEFHALLEEYEADWLILGPVAGSAEWAAEVRRGTKKLFSIGRSAESAHTYTSLTLERTTATLGMATLSGTSVRAFWASLHLEMVYFANDDDERYSIQAHTAMLRNLSVQASEPPFGYPVFSGLPTIVSTN